MGMFSRRTVQRLICENADFVSRKEIRQQIRRLSMLDSYLPAEWEIAVLNALSKLGAVEHEPDFGGRKKPDVFYQSNPPKSGSFVADVMTVSDKGLHQKNPIRELVNGALEKARVRELRLNSFRFKVGSRETVTPLGLRKETLRLPGLRRINETVLGPKFDLFIDEIARAPGKPHRYAVRDSDVDIIVFYVPNQEFGLIEAADYTESVDLNDNPIYERLCEKADQLDGTGDTTHHRGIFLCDGGCSLLRAIGPRDGYEIGDIVYEFLGQYEQIAFVCQLGAKASPGVKDKRIVSKLYKGVAFDSLNEDVRSDLLKLSALFPKPKHDPVNALNHLRVDGLQRGSSHLGGLRMGPNEVKISARVILQLLAGEITLEQFFELYRFGPEHGDRNRFATALREGRLFNDVALVKDDDEQDDDWLVFRFGDPDPAVAPFKLPTTK